MSRHKTPQYTLIEQVKSKLDKNSPVKLTRAEVIQLKSFITVNERFKPSALVTVSRESRRLDVRGIISPGPFKCPHCGQKIN